MVLQGQCELKHELKPAGPIQETLMNTIFVELCYVELIKAIEPNGDQEYKVQKQIESDLVVANADKLMFLVKDMVATLNKSFKKSMNPFWVGCLDLHSINHFSFPEITKEYFSDKSSAEAEMSFNRRFTES